MTQVIRTVEELEALDPDTILMRHEKVSGVHYMDPQRGWLDICEIGIDHIFPLVVIATGEHVRAAKQGLREQ